MLPSPWIEGAVQTANISSVESGTTGLFYLVQSMVKNILPSTAISKDLSGSLDQLLRSSMLHFCCKELSKSYVHNQHTYYSIWVIYIYISGWWFQPLWKILVISQWEGLSHVFWKIKNIWNHQPYICNILLMQTFSRQRHLKITKSRPRLGTSTPFRELVTWAWLRLRSRCSSWLNSCVSSASNLWFPVKTIDCITKLLENSWNMPRFLLDVGDG